MEYQAISQTIFTTDGDETTIKTVCKALAIPLDSNLLPMAWIEVMKNNPPVWMMQKDMNIRQNYDQRHTLAMWWLLKVNSNVPEWMQHDSNLKTKDGSTCLIIWLKNHKFPIPNWVLKNYNFDIHPFDYESHWKDDNKLSREESLMLFTKYNCPEWLVNWDETDIYNSDIETLQHMLNINELNDTMEFIYRFYLPRSSKTITNANILPLRLNNKNLQIKINDVIIKLHGEIYIKQNSFRPMKEYYHNLSISVPQIVWLKENTLDNICKLLDIIYGNPTPDLIENCGLFRYFPTKLHNPTENDNRIYTLIHESDYKYINNQSGYIPPRIIYDCDEIKGCNLKYYIEQGRIMQQRQNLYPLGEIWRKKYSVNEIFTDDIDYEFYDKHKHLLWINDLESMRKIVKYYIDNGKPIPPEVLNPEYEKNIE